MYTFPTAGLFIITTENSGSIVKHMVHGYIVKPGDEYELFTAINWAINNSVKVDEIRLKNFSVQGISLSSYLLDDLKTLIKRVSWFL